MIPVDKIKNRTLRRLALIAVLPAAIVIDAVVTVRLTLHSALLVWRQ